MNPGQIQNVTPMRGGGDSLPDPDELPGEFPGELSAHASERDRNKSRVLALAIASLIHVFLFVILARLCTAAALFETRICPTFRSANQIVDRFFVPPASLRGQILALKLL